MKSSNQHNCPGQIVVSGHKTLIDKLVEEGKAFGAKRVMPLAVSGPFHSSMMQVIEDAFSYILIDLNGRMPNSQ